MSILPDKRILEKIRDKSLVIDPFYPDFLGPNLYYCHLGNHFLLPREGIDLIDPMKMESKEIFQELLSDEPIIIHPQEFLLAESFEYFGIDNAHAIRLLNSSSFARSGISQAAVGMINPGCGSNKPVKLTLELINNAPFDVVLTPTKVSKNGTVSWGTEVLKIAVETMESEPNFGYDSWKHAVYHNDQKPSGPKMKGRFDEGKIFKIPKNSLQLTSLI